MSALDRNRELDSGTGPTTGSDAAGPYSGPISTYRLSAAPCSKRLAFACQVDPGPRRVGSAAAAGRGQEPGSAAASCRGGRRRCCGGARGRGPAARAVRPTCWSARCAGSRPAVRSATGDSQNTRFGETRAHFLQFPYLQRVRSVRRQWACGPGGAGPGGRTLFPGFCFVLHRWATARSPRMIGESTARGREGGGGRGEGRSGGEGAGKGGRRGKEAKRVRRWFPPTLSNESWVGARPPHLP